MNYFNRSRWWAVAFITLVVINVAMLATVWLIKGDHEPHRNMPGETVADFITRELSLDSSQQQKFFLLRTEHQQQVMDIRKKSRESKDLLFGLLKEPGTADSVIEKAAAASAAYDEQLDLVTFKHFQKVRALCNAQQRVKFDQVIQEVLRSMGGKPGPPPPPSN